MRLIPVIGLLSCAPLGSAGAVQFASPARNDSVSDVSYEQRFTEFKELRGVPNQVATVSGLILKRDAGEFTFANGKFYLLTPLGGRTVGAVFLGQGRMTFAPPSRIEQERLVRFQKSKTLDAPFSSLVLLFADSTMKELSAKLTFGPGEIPSEVRDRLRSSLDVLIDDDSKSLDPDLMSALLNNESNGIFYAHVGRLNGGPLMFMVNPSEVEGVSLSHRVRRYGWSRQSEVICRFPPGGQERPVEISGERVRQAEIGHYDIEVTLANTGSGDLSFAAAARVEITADQSLGPWIAFGLYEKLRVDSARWETGRPATVFKGKDGNLLWIKLESELARGETRPLKLYYHGDLIDRVVDFFFVKGSIDWYPRSLEGRSVATFDLTFRSPKDKLLASVGDQVESTTQGQVTTSRWVSSTPIRNASFNLGIFKDYQVQEEGIPPVTVLLAEGMHRKIGGLRQTNMKETVGGDLVKSLRFFQHVYGEVPAKRFFATEIPTNHGEAFPGLVNLSWWTFHQTDQGGEDEVFRAHEVAHQWWGIGVDFKSYHDQWLSEGIADFSGLWYLQTVRKDKKKYFDVLDRWRYRIMEHDDNPGPIWLGYRTTSSKDSTGYDVAVYKKGAWVMHMLRIMMLDLKTMNEDRFTETMRDFYTTYRGKRASTEDFRRIAEAHLGMDLHWFFDQWIYRAEIPTYKVAYKTEPAEGGQFRVKLRVRQENVGNDFQMYVPVMLDLGNDRIARVRAKVRGPLSEIDLPLLPAEPKSIRFNDLEGVLAKVSMEGWGK